MLNFIKFEKEIVGDNVNDFIYPGQLRENNSNLRFHEFGTSKQKYLKRIWTNYLNLKWEIERLNFVEVYFSIEKIPEHYKEGGIHNLEYFNYHYEYFRIKSISIIDYFALFINHSLQLGIPVRRCNFHSIMENTNLNDTELLQCLKAFHSDISNLKKDRNKIIHEGNFEPQSMVPLNDVIIDYEEKFIEENDIEQGELKKEEISKAITHFRNEIKMIVDNMELVLNNLIPHIKRQVQIFNLEELNK